MNQVYLRKEDVKLCFEPDVLNTLESDQNQQKVLPVLI